MAYVVTAQIWCEEYTGIEMHSCSIVLSVLHTYYGSHSVVLQYRAVVLCSVEVRPLV